MYNSTFETLPDGRVRLNVLIAGEIVRHDFVDLIQLEKYYKSCVTEKGLLEEVME
jgi:hypothetical protein